MTNLNGKPDAYDLIALVEKFLSDLAAREAGDARYHALMARAALEIAARELSSAGRTSDRQNKILDDLIADKTKDAAQKLYALANELRKGNHDGDPAIFKGLVALAELSLEESNPKALRESR